MEAYSANDYRFYLQHSWGTSPAQKLREKEYNKAYYEANKSKWGVNGERKTGILEERFNRKTRELENFVPTTDKEKEGAAKLITKDLNHLDKERAKQQYKVDQAIQAYTRMIAKASKAKTDEQHDKLNRKADEYLTSKKNIFDNLDKTNSKIEKALKDAEDIGLTVDKKDVMRRAEDISTIVAKSAVNLLTVPLTGTVVIPGATSINGTKYKVKYDKDKKNAELDADFAKISTEVSEASMKALHANRALDDYREKLEEELTPKYKKEYEKQFGKKFNRNNADAQDWVKGSVRDEIARTNDAKYSKLNDEYMKATEDYQRKKQDFDNWSKDSEKQESKYKTPEAVTKAVNDAKASGDEKEAKRLTNLYKEESAHKEKMANAPSDKKESKYETSEWKEQARKALANAKKNDRYDINFLETVQNDDYSTQKLLIEYEKYLKNPEKYMQTH